MMMTQQHIHIMVIRIQTSLHLRVHKRLHTRPHNHTVGETSIVRNGQGSTQYELLFLLRTDAQPQT